MISEIIAGKAPITHDVAVQFARVLEMPTAYWTNLENLYRSRLAEQRDHQRLAQQQEWAKRFPLAHMVRLGWLEATSDPVEKVKTLLEFFGVASVEAWEAMLERQSEQVAYRRSHSFQSAPESVSAWLRKGDKIAEKRQCEPFSAEGFKRVLDEVRILSREPPSVFQPKLIEMCASVGVIVVFTPELPKTCLSGTTRWLTKDKALIQLSLRHKTDDHLWFTFFHEAGHVLLHPKKPIIDEKPKKGEILDPETARREYEANVFAAAALIPRPAWKSFVSVGNFTAGRIQSFAKEQGISAGIVIGQLQHDKLIGYATALNSLKTKFEWASKRN